jgi:hypothetical protein
VLLLVSTADADSGVGQLRCSTAKKEPRRVLVDPHSNASNVMSLSLTLRSPEGDSGTVGASKN